MTTRNYTASWDLRHPLPAAMALALATGCPSETPPDGEVGTSTAGQSDGSSGGTVSDSDSMSTDGTSTGDATSGSDSNDGSDSSSGAAGGGRTPAAGITLETIVVNQGVAVPVWSAAGGFVDGTGRNAALLRDRPFAIYADWTVEADWTPRELVARLDLGDTMLETTVMVGGPAGDDPSQWFSWSGDASMASPNAGFQIELFEADDAVDGGSAPVLAPAEGRAPIGFEDEDLRIQVVLVPVSMQSARCTEDRTPTDEDADVTRTAIMQVMPVQGVDVSVSTSALVLGEYEAAGSFLAPLVQLRGDEGIPSGAFVAALLPGCVDDLDWDSIVGGIDVAESNTAARTGIVASTPDLGFTMARFAGLMTGRRNVDCPDFSAAATDPRYPYEDGSTGDWGFGVVDFEFRDPATHTDIMAQCPPAFASDYGWRASYAALQTINSWR